MALNVEKQSHGLPLRHERHSPHTARQLRITKSPGATPVTSGADLLDDAGGLVAEQEREVVVDAALPVVEIGVAHPARLDRHERLTRARVGNEDGLDPDRCTLGLGDDATNLVHEPVLPMSLGG